MADAETTRLKRRRKAQRTELWGRYPGAADLSRIDDDSHSTEEQREFARIYAEAGWTDLELRPVLPPPAAMIERLRTAAAAVLDMLPHGPGRYELSVALEELADAR